MRNTNFTVYSDEGNDEQKRCPRGDRMFLESAGVCMEKSTHIDFRQGKHMG